nr:hypothetical protein [Nitrospinaceae bacterium]NIR55334.1 hypothetical protein [Nitrospinaceae bacterium]NIS85773.1 hypothetical protein [Nitrospinaceae bacterium]NIT82623.1 hypothetical protein [Nitrospinaceae bacterium]NIU44828.1 hypothetical protein [Nitrospinaceae bacterium]
MRKIKTQSNRPSSQPLKNRLAVVSFGLAVFGLALVVRLVHLQIIRHDELAAQSEKQYMRSVEITSGRGNIYDRNMNQLATNVQVESVYADPQSVVDKKNTARVLARALH